MSTLKSRKVKFGKEKYAYWKSEIRKFQIGIEKCTNWKLKMQNW